MESNVLYLIWKDPISRRNFSVGKLEKNESFLFSYLEEAELAKKHGWEYLKSFPENKLYKSDKMFQIFSSRLPDKKRRDIDAILRKYQLDEYDEFELLKQSGARLPIDNYEFIVPILEENGSMDISFSVMGVRYYIGCKGKDCKLARNVNVDEKLKLIPEPDNKYDANAVMIKNKENELLGYVPRYYSEKIFKQLKKNIKYSCKVIEKKMDGSCSECIQVRLLMPDNNAE